MNIAKTPEEIGAEMARDYRAKVNAETRAEYLAGLEREKAARLAARQAEQEEALEREVRARWEAISSGGGEPEYNRMRAGIREMILAERLSDTAGAKERARQQALSTGRYAF